MKCTICDKEFSNLGVHMKKHSNEKLEEKIEEADPRYATKEDINSINSSLEKLTAILTAPTKVDVAMAIERPNQNIKSLERSPEETDKSPVPPKWRAIVDEILGTDFGINVVYPDQGNGFLFKLIVPLNKSNAEKAYLELYKVDIRTKSLSYSDGIDGVKRFCELVKANLQKNNNKPL